MRVAFESAGRLAADHPLIALSLLIFVGIPLLLGWMHEGRFFAECAIVGIRFFKHEVNAWRDFLRRLKRELTTWKADP
jgi:hypothetical protein